MQDFEGEQENLRQALDFTEDKERITIHLALAGSFGKSSDIPIRAEIRYLEQVMASEPEEEVAPVIERLAELYEKDERPEDALECRRKLLILDPWDRRDGILRVRRLEKKLGREFDDEHEREARRWLERDPGDFFTIITLAGLVLLRGDLEECIEIFLNGAKQSEQNVEYLSNAMRNNGAEYWKNVEVVTAFANALRDPVFSESANARTALCHLLRILGRWKEALEGARQGMDIARNNEVRTGCVTRAVEIMERLGKWGEVLEFIEEEFERRADDVNWPTQAAEAYLRVAVVCKGDERQHLLDRSLEILEEFENQTGPVQLSRILPLRYHILVARMGDEDRARQDLERIAAHKYGRSQELAMRALPEAERTILLSGRHWEKALEQTDRMAQYAHEEGRWKAMLAPKADLLFMLGKPEAVLDTLERLGDETVEENLDLQFLQLRCLEALGREDQATTTLARIRNELKPGEVHDSDLRGLSRTIRCELRFKDGLERASDAVRWIEIEDINQWSANAQSAGALYYVCFGSSEEAGSSLARLEQIGNYVWVADFLHDLKKIAEVHSLDVDQDALSQRFPL